MVEQAEAAGIKQHFMKSKRLALALSLSVASMALFLFYQFDRGLYERLSFWEVRVPVAAVIFMLSLGVIWYRARRHRGPA